MSNIYEVLTTIKRPGMLVRAARHGLEEYNRDKHLHRLIGERKTPNPQAIANLLFDLEQDHESRRRAKDAGYNPRRHIDVLCALMAEARFLSASRTHRHSA